MFSKVLSGFTLFLLLFVLSTSTTNSAPKQPLIFQEQKKNQYNLGDIIIRYKTNNTTIQSTIAKKISSNTSQKMITKNGIFLLHSDDLKTRADNASKAQAIGTSSTKDSVGIDAETQATLDILRQDPNVLYAEPNYQRQLLFTPDDTSYSDQWSLNNTGQTGGTTDADIDATEAWDTTKGDTSVIVAVIDTGVDLTHPDLVNKILKDGSGNVVGYDFGENDSDPTDNYGHGSHCAGIIAAETNNTLGVAGVCPNCKIMPLKISDAYIRLPDSAIIPAFQYAIDHGADVASNSWGGGPYSQAIQDVITSARNHNVIVVFSAGNDYSSYPVYPAAMDNVIAVAATDDMDKKASFSNYDNGSGWIDVSAPGVDILSTVPTGTCRLCDASGYALLSGTSMAAPHVAGLFGLLRSQNPSATVDFLETQLLMTVDTIDSVNPRYEGLLGSGRINANAALITTPGPKIIYKASSYTDTSPDGNADGYIQPGETITLSVTTKNTWENATNVTIDLSSTDTFTTITQATSHVGSFPSDTEKIATFVFDYEDIAPISHTIDFTLNVTDTAGYTSSIPFSLTTGIPPTATSTWTFTPTRTSSHTVTSTFTITPRLTSTHTTTSTATITSTHTFTPTFTKTKVPTFTRTFTKSPSNTFTPTATKTPTSTRTPSFTKTSTYTKTITPTASSTKTATATKTPTTTKTTTTTRTPSTTYTPSNTTTFTLTPSVTSTPTITPPVTSTRTKVPTITPTSNSSTYTFTPSNTATITLTPTASSTSTNTPTATPTRAKVPTFTPIGGSGSPQVFLIGVSAVAQIR